MKNIILLLVTLVSLPTLAQVDYSIPETPKKIEFANVIVNLDIETQKKVGNYVTSLLTPQNSYLENKLELMQWYFPYIEEILDEENVPDDLKYLAVQESALKPDALSSSAAVGFWQFKEATGKELGLVINNNIDERKYLFASTKAAATYFKKNNLIFKNWISCIYAYNQGPTGATKAIPDNWSYASEVDFNEDTPEYLLKALAHRIAFEHRLNRLKASPRKLLVYPTRSKSLAQIAVELSVDLSELRTYNAWLNSASTPSGVEYKVLIPINKAREQEILELISNRKETITSNSNFPVLVKKTLVTTSDDQPILYDINGRVGILAEPGDEASQLASKAGFPLSTFLKLNDLDDKHIVKTGRVYYLEKKANKAPVEFHTARKGQTFWDISQMYAIKLKKLLKYNRLKSPETIQPGRVIWLQKKRPKNQPIEIVEEVLSEDEYPTIPVETRYERDDVVTSDPDDTEEDILDNTSRTNNGVIKLSSKEDKPEVEKPVVKKVEPKPEPIKPKVIDTKAEPIKTRPTTPKPKEEPTRRTHLVRQGETLYSISKQYGLSLSELRRLNNMSSSDILRYGEELIVNRNAASSVASSSRSEVVYHNVEKGETLYSLSKMYNTTVGNIQNWNDIRGTNISIGEKLIVSQNGINVSNYVSENPSTHTVSKGETLYSISKRYNISLSNLKSINNINSNIIEIGQVLRIK
ncbi:LysM peptidoglycan-binding domain-containing protein [uncultured Arcticibacterium sp.]|uniref:LysM peptidoglycan-binding domain-containing protein n=1 Tax=uncultured Arcticibacterium sp. TaxID=2173042 RepID=UPI0030F8921F